MKTEVEHVAQRAAREELAAFMDAILNSRVAAEKAAQFLGGNTLSRFEAMIKAVRHARTYLETMTLSETATVKRSLGRRKNPPFVLRERPEPDRQCRVADGHDLAMPLKEAEALRMQGLSWRQISERLLVASGE